MSPGVVQSWTRLRTADAKYALRAIMDLGDHVVSGQIHSVSVVPNVLRYDMTALEALKSVQFVTVNGRRLAVLDAEDWESVVEWLETVEDVDVAKEARQTFEDAGRSREAAGWHHWDSVRDELE
jgi:hypothetical protein